MLGVALFYACRYMSHTLSLRFAAASAVAPFFNPEPVVATVTAAAILDERLQTNQYGGGGLVFAALLVSKLIEKWKK